MTPGISRLLVLTACLRPHLLLPALLAAATAYSWRGADPLRPDASAVTALAGWCCVLLGVNALNLAADRRTDRLNAKNTFWMGILHESALQRLGWAFVGIGLAGGGIAAGAGRPVAIGITAATALLGWAYSLPPLRLSHRWGWDAAANVAGYAGIAPLLGAVLAAEPPGAASDLFAPAAGYLAPVVLAAFLVTTVLDRRGDRAAGKRTCGVRFPVRAVLIAALVALAGGGVWLFAGSSAPFAAAAGGGHALIVVLLIATAARPHRPLLIAAVYGLSLLAGVPALAVRPVLAVPLAGWLLASLLVTAGAVRTGRRA